MTEVVDMGLKLFDGDGDLLPVKFLGFSGGERHVQLLDFSYSEKFYIKSNIWSSDDIMDLLILSDALNRKFDNISIDVEIPYLPYARQDRVCSDGQSFSLNVFSRILSTIKSVENIYIWDAHSQVAVELTGAVNIKPQYIIKSSNELVNIITDFNSVMICPDKGAVKRTNEIVSFFEKDFQPDHIVYCEKVRDPSTGQITHTDVRIDNLEGRTAIITDDICDGGYTFIKIAEQLKDKGAKEVILFVTHGIFSKGLDVFDGLIDHIFTTNSFKHEQDNRLTVIPFSTNLNN